MAGSAVPGWLSAALLGAVGLASGGTALAAQAAGKPADPATVAPAADAPPSAQMLLYFAEFEDTEGDFVDPLALESAEAQQLGQKQQPSKDKDQAVDEQAPRTH